MPVAWTTQRCRQVRQGQQAPTECQRRWRSSRWRVATGLRRREWPAHREEEARREAEFQAARTAAYGCTPLLPSPPQRTIKDPFNGYEMDVDASEPEWLGQHTLRQIVNQKGERQRQESR